MTSILTLDPNADPADLAAQIVALPDGIDMGSDCVGALGRVLLTGKPEERNPAKYAQIFDLVREKLTVTEWMRYAAWAESVNGRRRCKGADMSAIADELGALARSAERNVPESAHKYTLLGIICYNRGIVCRGLRRYDDETRAQRESAAWYALAGNPAKSDTSLFAAQVGAVSAAFVAGEPDQIRSSVLALVAVRTFVSYQAYPYPAWMVDSAPLHIGWALMMSQLFGAFRSDELDAYKADFAAGEGSRFAAWEKVFVTWRAYVNGDFGAVIAVVPDASPSSSLDNTQLTMRILAALAKRDSDPGSAREMLEAVANHAGPDGGIPIAVAKKLLASV